MNPPKTDGPRIVDWYRTDPSPRIRRVLALGPAGLAVGGLVIAAAFFLRRDPTAQACATAGGLAVVAAAAVYTVLTMHRILREDVHLAIRTDGVSLQSASQDTLVPWEALESVRWDADARSIVVSRTTGADIVLAGAFARIDGPSLVRTLEQARRKAALGLLR